MADALSYAYPTDLNMVFSSGSLLHVPLEDMPTTIAKVATALKTGGIFYISTKERPEYIAEPRTDEHGERMFYYYTVPLLSELASEWFEPVYEAHQVLPKSAWLTLALKRI